MFSAKANKFVLDEISSELRNTVRSVTVTSPWRESGKLSDEEIESITQHVQQVLLADIDALLAKKTHEPQKAKEFFLPEQFDPEPSKIASLDPQTVSVFLKHVASGNQDEAEKLLKENCYLALASGIVTDHAHREFQEITGFQYAVWALDWHMWEMISHYMTLKAVKEQLEQARTGSWVDHYGEHVSWQELTRRMDFFLWDINNYSTQEQINYWCTRVGAEQLKLPMHVLQEYCQPNRPFIPCPDFTTPMSRVQVDDIESLGAKDYPQALSRGKKWEKEIRCEGLPSLEVVAGDREALIKLYETRLEQRNALFSKRHREEKHSESDDSKSKHYKSELGEPSSSSTQPS